MGSDITKNANSNVIHNFNENLSGLIVKLLISPDGTDNNSFEVGDSDSNTGSTVVHGYSINQVDTNNVLVQTGAQGIIYVEPAGGGTVITTQDWYYKIVVFKLIP